MAERDRVGDGRRAELTALPPFAARLHGIAAIAAPLLLLASTLAFIVEGDGINEGVLGGTIGVWSVFALSIAFIGILRAVEPRAPRAAPILTAVAVVGFAAGVAFNVQAIFTPVFGPEIDEFLDNVDGSDAIAILAFLPWGLFTPLTFVATGILLWRTEAVARASAGLLVAGGVLFVASRPERIEPLALVADVTLVLALAPLGWAMIRSAGARRDDAEPAEVSPATP